MKVIVIILRNESGQAVSPVEVTDVDCFSDSCSTLGVIANDLSLLTSSGLQDALLQMKMFSS